MGGHTGVDGARDSKLKRDVAIKVLPASVAADADRLARFQREAEVLAALNDPHIAAIYGLEAGPFGKLRAGWPHGAGDGTGRGTHVALSPGDGRTLAASILDPRSGTQDLWLIDIENDSAVLLTTTRGYAAIPVWSANGRRLAYAYQPPGQMDDVYVRDTATGEVTPVFETPGVLEHPAAWSRDGASLLVFTADDDGTYLSTWSLASRTLTRFAGPRALEFAAFSPRNELVAFTSLESGRPEVYVTTFPHRRQTWSVTTDGGRVLSWSQDGREILVATLAGHIVAYPVATTDGFSHGQPSTLVRDVGSQATYSSARRDHSRIVIRVNPDAAKDRGEMQLLFGWQAGLRPSAQ